MCKGEKQGQVLRGHFLGMKSKRGWRRLRETAQQQEEASHKDPSDISADTQTPRFWLMAFHGDCGKSSLGEQWQQT